MFCVRCGAQNPDSANFCQGCGAPMKQEERFTPERADTPLAALKRVASSPVAIIAAVTLLLGTVLNFYSIFTATDSLTNQLSVLDSSFTDSIPSYFGDLMAFMSACMMVSQIPAILNVIGLFMTIASAKKSDEQFSTAGLTLIKVIVVIGLVLISILTLVFNAFMCAWLTGMIMADNSSGYALALVTVIYDLVLGFCIFYQAMVVRSINAAKDAATAKDGAYIGRNASAFVGVMLFISAGMNLFSASSYIIAFQPISALQVLLTAAAYICLGVLLFMFRKEMKRFMK